jgi:hypothetical protein
MVVAVAPVVQLVAEPGLQALVARAPKVARQHAVALVVSETRFHPVAVVAAPEVVVAAGMAVAVLAFTAVAVLIVTAEVAEVAATGQPAELSPPAATAVQPPLQVAADESSFLIAQPIQRRRPRLGTSQLAEMPLHHVMRAGVRVGPSGPTATPAGSSAIKRSI